MCVCMYTHTHSPYHSIGKEVDEQPLRGNSLPSPCVSWESNQFVSLAYKKCMWEE